PKGKSPDNSAYIRQYAINSNNAIRFNWDYEKQNYLDWMKSSLGYVWFF
ncbi:TPA: hypothetical protein ACXJMU_003693, partial [Acinetobacter baumannii]